MIAIEIINYEKQYHEDFRRLSYEWLEKYVSVEPEDERILANPQEIILDKGGYIFLAVYRGEVVGTVSLIKVDEIVFELAKFAVTEQYQGLGIARRLMDHCLKVARQEQSAKIILYTNHKLVSAIALYRKYDFVDVPIVDNKYLESDMRMELRLS
ncbi:GNAT family N-acetyltransferase [Paenibacillus sp. GCM10012306]|uniref:GNAT family N-acetyltransferase n=1 Tax=Paenibacillus sp. GCM10012306 TaxID=3317342 RepID=UPI00361C78A1